MEQSLIERGAAFLKSKGLPPWAVEVSLFGGIFVVLGYLFKSFGRWLVFLILAGIAALAVIHYAQLMELPLEHWKTLAGIQGVEYTELPHIFTSWAREHTIACISAVIGFIVGWKLG